MNQIRYLNDEELKRFGKIKKNAMYYLAFDLCLTYALRAQELVNLRMVRTQLSHSSERPQTNGYPRDGEKRATHITFDYLKS
jgi:integrase